MTATKSKPTTTPKAPRKRGAKALTPLKLAPVPTAAPQLTPAEEHAARQKHFNELKASNAAPYSAENPFAYCQVIGHPELDPSINRDFLSTVHPSRRAAVLADYPQLTPASPPAAQATEASTPKAPRTAAGTKIGQPKRSGGVLQAIVNQLQGASAKSPLTKAELVERLAQLFPDREPDKMRATVNTQLPTRLAREQEVEVGTDGEGGYWIK